MRRSIFHIQILFLLICIIIYLITKLSISKNVILSNDDYLHCLLSANKALKSLSLPWFFTFGTALSYWRSKNFISHDIDIGIFSDDLYRNKITDEQLVSTMIRKSHFKFLHRFGEINHGQEWAYRCPNANINLDIFVFYHLNKTSDYWTATYTGLCDKMRYKKCRWKFRKFQIKTLKILEETFSIVPLTFIKERYGNNYRIKKDYDYHESLKFLPNLIEEYNENNSHPINRIEKIRNF